MDTTKKIRVPIKNGEVLQYANKMCSQCVSPGLHVSVPYADGKPLRNPEGQIEKRATVCHKAFRRFAKANPDVAFDEKTGEFYRMVDVVEEPEFVKAVSEAA